MQNHQVYIHYFINSILALRVDAAAHLILALLLLLLSNLLLLR
ncbi:hypothetical protein [uncultured Acetobacteroides sp.]|nr:hypothetical protein [uncultured Acetobacteroides sp.]